MSQNLFEAIDLCVSEGFPSPYRGTSLVTADSYAECLGILIRTNPGLCKVKFYQTVRDGGALNPPYDEFVWDTTQAGPTSAIRGWQGHPDSPGAHGWGIQGDFPLTGVMARNADEVVGQVLGWRPSIRFFGYRSCHNPNPDLTWFTNHGAVVCPQGRDLQQPQSIIRYKAIVDTLPGPAFYDAISADECLGRVLLFNPEARRIELIRIAEDGRKTLPSSERVWHRGDLDPSSTRIPDDPINRWEVSKTDEDFHVETRIVLARSLPELIGRVVTEHRWNHFSYKRAGADPLELRHFNLDAKKQPGPQVEQPVPLTEYHVWLNMNAYHRGLPPIIFREPDDEKMARKANTYFGYDYPGWVWRQAGSRFEPQYWHRQPNSCSGMFDPNDHTLPYTSRQVLIPSLHYAGIGEGHTGFVEETYLADSETQLVKRVLEEFPGIPGFLFKRGNKWIVWGTCA